MKYLLLFFVNLLLIFVFIGLSVVIILNPFFITGVTLEGYRNDYCQSDEAAIIAKDPSNPLNLVCDNKYKKEKFIWLFLDGLAYDQLAKIPRDKDQLNITNFFRIKSKEYKQSGSLHEIIITGKFSRNYPAQTTRIDHIFRQVRQSNNTNHLIFQGTEFPLVHLLGKNQSDIFSLITIKHFEPFPFDSLCPNDFNLIREDMELKFREKYTISPSPYLKSDITHYELYTNLINHYKDTNAKIPFRLEHCMKGILNPKKPESLIFYTMRMDHMNHSFDKKHIKTLFNAFTFESGIIAITKWIDKHPEYAFIVSSDHGGQAFNGEDAFCNHGCDNEGNEAIFMVYTKELGYDYQQLHQDNKFIWVDNEAPTVAQIIKNVNIPLEAQGLAYELGNDNILKYAAIKSKEIQLKQFIKKVMMKYPHKEPLMSKLMKTIEGSEYADKFIKMDDVIKMDDKLYQEYQQYLIVMQNEISNAISKDNHSILYSLLYYVIIGGLLVKVIIEIKQINTIITIQNAKNNISEQKNQYHHIILLAIILFVLSIELILCFIFSNHKLSDMITISRQIECFLLFVASLYYLWVFGYDRKIFYTLLFLLFGIVSVIMINYNIFMTIRMFLSQYPLSIYINIYLNYPAGLMYLLYKVYCLKDYYLDSKLRIKLCYVMYPLCIVMMIALASFDYGIPENFHSHTLTRMIVIRILYSFLGLIGLLSFKQLWKKVPINSESKEPIQIKRTKSLLLAKFSVFFYIFFISDETERLTILLIFIPFSSLFIRQFKKERNMYWKLLSFCFILMIPDILYIVTQNTFSFDISLKVTNKCIGPYADHTPILTGILMGTHKLKFFILTAADLLSVSRIDIMNFMKNDSFLIRITLDVQMGMMICLYCFYLWRGYEHNYLEVFMWIMTKCMVSEVFDLPILFWYIVNHCRKKKFLGQGDIIEDSQNNKFSQIIELESQRI